MMKLGFVAIAAVLASPASAQTRGMDHSSMGHGDMRATPVNPFPPSEMRMHERMMKAQGVDATETWVRKMIEHHRGGIEMSQIVIRQTRDPKVRQMATKTVSMQQKEVAELNAWLRAHGKRVQ